MEKEKEATAQQSADNLPGATKNDDLRKPLHLVSYFTREQVLHSMNIVNSDPMASDVTRSAKLLDIQNRILLDIRDLLFNAAPVVPVNVAVPDLAQAAADSIKK